MNAGGARVYPMAAAASVAFAVWGSLFPFDFHRMSLERAAGLSWIGSGSEPTTWSSTDVVSNVLLFVPVGLFSAAALDRTRVGRSAVLLVLVAGVLLSASVELAQTLLPGRTPSILDVLAQGIGTGGGLVLWRSARTAIDRAVSAGAAAWGRSSGFERLLVIYSAVFACAWLLPFDFTLRPDEIRDKYEHQRLLFPFTPSPDAATSFQLTLTAAAAVPLGMAAALCGRPQGGPRSLARAATLAALGVLALELAQVSVFSRTTDATEFVVALPGAALGAAMARLRHHARREAV